MTTPTSDQLAHDVPPNLRDYIEARAKEMTAELRAEYDLKITAAHQSAEHANKRLIEMEQFERAVRGHLGL